MDKGDRELGAIKAQSPDEWIVSEVSLENLLAIASTLPGFLEPGAGMVASFIDLIGIGYGWVQNYNSIGVTYESTFGDYAEWLPRRNPREEVGYGDIVGIRSGFISKDLTGGRTGHGRLQSSHHHG